MSADDLSTKCRHEAEPLFKRLFYVCYQVALEEVADHCVLEGTNTAVLFEDYVPDEPFSNVTKKKKIAC